MKIFDDAEKEINLSQRFSIQFSSSEEASIMVKAILDAYPEKFCVHLGRDFSFGKESLVNLKVSKTHNQNIK
jgi:hypothetical protein